MHSSRAAIDLASIMVGIIIIGLVGSVIAATVFAVIPWAQDNAAKHQLSSITTAQNGYSGLSDAHSYTDSATLNDASLLQAGTSYCTVASADGKSYTGYSRSATGRIFMNSSENTAPRLTTDMGCLPASGVGGGSTTTDPALAQTSSFTFNCPAGTTSTQLPISAATGTEKWNDGVTNTYSNQKSAARTVTPGTTYTVTFVGTFKNLATSSTAGPECIRSMDSWGPDSGTISASYGFYNASNLSTVPSTLPATVTDTSYMFGNTDSFNQNLNSWDMSRVTTTRSMFTRATAFNGDITQWKLTSVIDAGQMFLGATSFNQPVGSWDTSSIGKMDGMFQGATSFNQSINSWNVKNVTTMNLMFQQATAFNQPLNNWVTTNLTDIKNMFMGATSFNQSVDSFNVSGVSDFSNVFKGATAFNQNLNNWSTTKATNMTNMFQGATKFNGTINSWNVSQVQNFSTMFQKAPAFNQPLNNWTPTSATDMTSMFQQATIFNQNISGWNVDNVTAYSNFRTSSALTDANTPAKLRV